MQPSLRTALAAVLAILTIANAGCAKKTRPEAPTPYVQTAVAQFGSIAPDSAMSGLIAPYENVAIQSTLTEPADAVYVQEGDRVYKGEVLAKLDTSDLQAQMNADLATANANHANTAHTVYQGSLSITQGDQGLNAAQAGVEQAQATLQRDTRDLQRDYDLFTQGYLSQQTYQAQQATVRNDQGALQSAQSNLRSAQATVAANGSTLSAPGLQSSSVAQSRAQEQVALSQANQVRVSIDKATILSPIDGVVVNRNLNPGEYPGNRQIFTLQQVSPIYAVLRGSGDQIAGIYPGTIAGVTLTESGGARRTYSGKVIGVLNEIQPGSTQFQVKVLLQNPKQELRPGMVVQGSVALPSVRGVRIPSTAFTDDNRDAVQTVQSDNTVKTVKVTEVATDGTTSVVSGLQQGVRVVANGQSSIGDGEKVSYRQ